MDHATSLKTEPEIEDLSEKYREKYTAALLDIQKDPALIEKVKEQSDDDFDFTVLSLDQLAVAQKNKRRTKKCSQKA